VDHMKYRWVSILRVRRNLFLSKQFPVRRSKIVTFLAVYVK
jgi:hypothetical protein